MEGTVVCGLCLFQIFQRLDAVFIMQKSGIMVLLGCESLSYKQRDTRFLVICLPRHYMATWLRQHVQLNFVRVWGGKSLCIIGVYPGSYVVVAKVFLNANSFLGSGIHRLGWWNLVCLIHPYETNVLPFLPNDYLRLCAGQGCGIDHWRNWRTWLTIVGVVEWEMGVLGKWKLTRCVSCVVDLYVLFFFRLKFLILLFVV